MVKYFVCFLLFFSPLFGNSLNAQDKPDTMTVAPDTSETNTRVTPDTVKPSELELSSLPEPQPDSIVSVGDSLREVSAAQVKSYTLNPDYAYANDSAYWKKEAARKPGFQFNWLSNPFLRWTIFIAIIALVFFGIYQLIRESTFSWLLRKTRVAEPDISDSSVDEEPDYEETIGRYQREGNYRLAVRYMYLRLLSKARENGEFQIRHFSTNAELIRLFESFPYGKEFRYLTMAYEHIFYGGFLPGEELYHTLKSRFDSFQQILTV